MIAAKNLDVQISLLEAKLGLCPSIAWCSEAIKSHRVQQKIASAAPTPKDLEKKLHELRKQKTEQKLFFIQKEVQRAAKKGKMFLVRKIIKKIKGNRAEGKEVEALGQELEKAKKVNHQSEAGMMFKREILGNSNDFVKECFGKFNVECGPDNSEVLVIAGKALERTISDLKADLNSFFRRLLHIEVIKVPGVSHISTASKDSNKESEYNSNEDDHGGASEDTDVDEPDVKEYFVSSLDKTDLSKKRAHSVQWDDQECELDVEKRRKNRMGQKARRQQWEQKYGYEAKHLKKGDGERDPCAGTRDDRLTFKSRDRSVKSQDRFAKSQGKHAKSHDNYGQRSRAEPNIHPSRQPPNDLHPSWEAKQVAKKREQEAKFSGTKITFAD